MKLTIDSDVLAYAFIEPTKEYFEELRQAGLKATYIEFRWGEIGSVVEPLHREDTDRTMEIL